jgi:flavodoxin
MTLPGKHFAIFGLGDSAYPQFTGAVNHLEEFVKKLGGKLVIESCRIDGFFFDQENNEKKLTDWSARLDNILKTSL